MKLKSRRKEEKNSKRSKKKGRENKNNWRLRLMLWSAQYIVQAWLMLTNVKFKANVDFLQ